MSGLPNQAFPTIDYRPLQSSSAAHLSRGGSVTRNAVGNGNQVGLVTRFQSRCRLPSTNPSIDEVAVGTIIADRPPHRSVRALISAYGSYLGYVAAKRSSCFPHTRQTV